MAAMQSLCEALKKCINCMTFPVSGLQLGYRRNGPSHCGLNITLLATNERIHNSIGYIQHGLHKNHLQIVSMVALWLVLLLEPSCILTDKNKLTFQNRKVDKSTQIFLFLFPH
jgi:hypothetical protein